MLLYIILILLIHGKGQDGDMNKKTKKYFFVGLLILTFIIPAIFLNKKSNLEKILITNFNENQLEIYMNLASIFYEIILIYSIIIFTLLAYILRKILKTNN